MSTLTIATPADALEAAEVVREAARSRHVVLATGTNSKRSWTRAPDRIDVELSTRALSGIVAYEPGDGVITALAGTPWAELERAVAANGHHVSPWISASEDATVGGVVAAGQSGADRLRFGPVRHHVLGLRVVDGEGRIVKSGGRLVKNVTGFDLHRLHTGAHGTLGLITEVSLRLHAAPEVRAIGLGFAPTRAVALATARAVLARSRSAWTVLVHDRVRDGARDRTPEQRWAIAVLSAGLAETVDAEVRTLRAAVPSLRFEIGERGTPDEARVLDAWNSAAEMAGRRATVRVTSAQSGVDAVLTALDAAAADAKLDVHTCIQPALGCIDVWIRDVDSTTVQSFTTRLARARASVHWCGLDDELRTRVDLFGPTDPAGLALMRRLKSTLDPLGTFVSGRLAGGL